MKLTYLPFMRRPVFRRRDSHSGFCTELGNLIGDVQAGPVKEKAKGKGTSGHRHEAESTNAPLRLRLLHSSVEVGVMPMERRKQAIAVVLGQPETGGARKTTGG